ncbi:MAG: Uma2 family endonuclease [Bacteroidota bacterium]
MPRRFLRHLFHQTHKFRLYRSLPSFEEYVMVDQEQAVVESFVRIADDKWQIRTFLGLNSIVAFKSLEIEVAMKDIYEDVIS